MSDTTTDSQGFTQQQRTQATTLKPTFDNKIGSIPVLEVPEDFESWKSIVINTLRMLRIEELIDMTIPRPRVDDEKFQIWCQASLTIRDWLGRSVSRDIVERLLRLPVPDVYADEYFEAIIFIVIGESCPSAWEAWFRTVLIRRDQYDSMESFVTTYQGAVNCAATFKWPITPCQATGYLLQEARDEVQTFYRIRWDEFSEMEPAEVTHEYFVETCSSIIEQARAQEIRHR